MLRIMKNGVPQGSILSPMLFNINIIELMEKKHLGRTVILVDVLQRQPSCKEMEEGLTKDMLILVKYLRNWRLQLGVGNTVSAAHRAINREWKLELNVFAASKRVVSQQTPKYIGVRLDRMLSFKQHLEEV